VDEQKVNKPKSRKLPVQKNFADTCENNEHPIKGQLKQNRKCKRGASVSLAWNEDNRRQ